MNDHDLHTGMAILQFDLVIDPLHPELPPVWTRRYGGDSLCPSPLIIGAWSAALWAGEQRGFARQAAARVAAGYDAPPDFDERAADQVEQAFLAAACRLARAARTAATLERMEALAPALRARATTPQRLAEIDQGLERLRASLRTETYDE